MARRARPSFEAIAGSALVALGALGALGGLVFACSLDLDESLIARAHGPILDGAVDGDNATSPDGTTTGLAPIVTTPCSSDEVCKTTQGCVAGKCDLARKTCVYDVCRPSACTASACSAGDVGTRTCAPPAAYNLKAAQWNMGARVACARCAVAVHPFLYVATGVGVTAFNVSNPTNTAPPQVPITGLTFAPTQLVASGSRVWMVGAVNAGAPNRLPIAWVDSPPDPFATTIAGRSVTVTYPRVADITLFARAGDSALLVGPATSAVAVEAPLADDATLTPTPMQLAQNMTANATSGKRLLVGGVTAQSATFSLVDNAGTPPSPTGPVVPAGDPGLASVARTLAQGPAGAIFWATGVHQTLLPSVNPVTRAVRGYFLVANDTLGIDPNIGVDVEVYDPAAVGGAQVQANAGVVGPAAMVGPKLVVAAVQAHENPTQTAVLAVSRDPLGVVKDNNAPRRLVLPFAIGTLVGATASNGVAYLIANDQAGPPPTSTVYVIDPACAP